MRSVLPTVSSVAWASYMTGVNPAKHNIFGFVERRPDPLELTIPTAAQLKRETLWEILSRAGRRVAVINVPMSYPPRPVNGVMVGCFLSPSLEKAVYPPSLVPTLRGMGYRIDVDAWKARTERESFLADANEALDRRFEAAFHLMDREEWDFFQLHIMETDRVNHFLWSAWEAGDPVWAPRFLDLYRRIDGWVGRLLARLGGGLDRGELLLLVLSDHGFCRVEKEFYVNRWLEQEGYLRFPRGGARKLPDLLEGSRAYSLIPGRIFLHLRGREQKGCVEPGGEYEALREELVRGLEAVQDPETGSPMVRRVHRREEIYRGPFLERAADLILEPHDGYDPKGDLDKTNLVSLGEIHGMHTLEDAFLLSYPESLPERNWSIPDVMPGILQHMGVDLPPHLDGRPWRVPETA
jgi:predicted AlkP superfamily phosphohydrolase/phosphomutase